MELPQFRNRVENEILNLFLFPYIINLYSPGRAKETFAP